MRVCVCISFINFGVFLYDCEPLKSMPHSKKKARKERSCGEAREKERELAKKQKSGYNCRSLLLLLLWVNNIKSQHSCRESWPKAAVTQQRGLPSPPTTPHTLPDTFNSLLPWSALDFLLLLLLPFVESLCGFVVSILARFSQVLLTALQMKPLTAATAVATLSRHRCRYRRRDKNRQMHIW